MAVRYDRAVISRIRRRLNRNCHIERMASVNMNNVVFVLVKPLLVRPILPDIAQLSLM